VKEIKERERKIEKKTEIEIERAETGGEGERES